jgi:hypothetical protein
MNYFKKAFIVTSADSQTSCSSALIDEIAFQACCIRASAVRRSAVKLKNIWNDALFESHMER